MDGGGGGALAAHDQGGLAGKSRKQDSSLSAIGVHGREAKLVNGVFGDGGFA